jgi:hypothetical protein
VGSGQRRTVLVGDDTPVAADRLLAVLDDAVGRVVGEADDDGALGSHGE